MDYAIDVDVPDENIVKRMGGRRACVTCGATYHVVHIPPKKEGICDKCGHEIVQRKDDNVETVEARLDSYFKQTSPLVEYYEKQGNLYTATVSKTINKMGKDVAKEMVEMIENQK